MKSVLIYTSPVTVTKFKERSRLMGWGSRGEDGLGWVGVGGSRGRVGYFCLPCAPSEK